MLKSEREGIHEFVLAVVQDFVHQPYYSINTIQLVPPYIQFSMFVNSADFGLRGWWRV